jgi:hypothetical protein
LQLLDHVGVAAGGHEADVLAVGLVGDGEAEARGISRTSALGMGMPPSGKAQEVELLARGGEQEIALVALGSAARCSARPPRGPARARDVVAGRQRVGAEVARGLEQVGNLTRWLQATQGSASRRAHSSRRSRSITAAEAALVVEHVVRDAEALGDARASWMSWPAQQAPLRWVAAPWS